MDRHRLLGIVAMTLIGFTSCVLAETYASNLELISKTSTSLSVSWTIASSNLSASYYVLTVDDSSNKRTQTVTITDLTLNNMTFTGLQQVKSYTFTLTTYDSDDNVIGLITTLRVSTVYDTWNTKAIVAMGVAGLIVLSLLVAKMCVKCFNPDKNQEKWRKEVLLLKQRQKEEKRRRKSSNDRRVANNNVTKEEDLEDINVPI